MIQELEKSPSIQQFEAEIHHSFVIEELTPAAKAFVTARALAGTKKSILIITGAGPEEFKLYNDLPFFTNAPLIELPAWETLPSEKVAPSPDIVGARYKALLQLANKKEPVIVLSTLQGCLQKVLARSTIIGEELTLKIGMKIGFEELVS